jgi:hypothetical protein
MYVSLLVPFVLWNDEHNAAVARYNVLGCDILHLMGNAQFVTDITCQVTAMSTPGMPVLIACFVFCATCCFWTVTWYLYSYGFVEACRQRAWLSASGWLLLGARL